MIDALLASFQLSHVLPFLGAALGILLVDLLLSGDNAIVIGMVTRGLPKRQRMAGVILGALAAVGMRIGFAFALAWIIDWLAGLYVLGGLALLYIAFKMLKDASDDVAEEEDAATSLFQAVVMITIADLSMSFDNVVAIAALAKGDVALMVFGLLMSIPLVVFGATLVQRLIDRLPWVIWLGAALLGWIAGEMIVKDPIWGTTFHHAFLPHFFEYLFGVFGVIFVLAAGFINHLLSRPDEIGLDPVHSPAE
ncbi:TerC family protein [Methylobacterium indicum]|uniref:Membrane protein n=1 Tax=Methylobacterium indicum TaxID=1775910 RepID=A0A8H8X1A9_9HYPH|nr:TerC family protein [Methylobacterium indicum]BCM87864.1 membrane protein [Methylobacterium indicum]